MLDLSRKHNSIPFTSNWIPAQGEINYVNKGLNEVSLDNTYIQS